MRLLVTVFTRRRRRPAFEDAIEHIRGDRTDHAAFVQALRGRSFDVVVDNVAFERPDVEAVVEAFRPIPEDAADLSLRGDLAYRRAATAAATRKSCWRSASLVVRVENK